MIPLRRLPATLLLALAACVGEPTTGPDATGTAADAALTGVTEGPVRVAAAAGAHADTLSIDGFPAQLAGRTVSVQAEIFLSQTFQDPNVENNFGEWFVQVVAPLPGGDITTLAFPRLRRHL